MSELYSIINVYKDFHCDPLNVMLGTCLEMVEARPKLGKYQLIKKTDDDITS